jgi:hypothetical protein
MVVSKGEAVIRSVLRLSQNAFKYFLTLPDLQQQLPALSLY